MTFEMDQKLRPELGRDERLLWSGVPKQGLRFRSSDWFAVPFTLFWCSMVFGVFPQGHAGHAASPLYATPFGIPFVAMGIYMLVGRFFVDWYQRTRTYYGVTDQHVLIVSGVFSRQVNSMALSTLSEISLKERGDRSGTITFGPGASSSSWFSYNNSWSSRGARYAPSFDMIEDARKVYTLIRDAQQQRTRAAA